MNFNHFLPKLLLFLIDTMYFLFYFLLLLLSLLKLDLCLFDVFFYVLFKDNLCLLYHFRLPNHFMVYNLWKFNLASWNLTQNAMLTD
jgi:hypothetical protein